MATSEADKRTKTVLILADQLSTLLANGHQILSVVFEVETYDADGDPFNLELGVNWNGFGRDELEELKENLNGHE
jgi:hypothetical protein